MAKKAAAPTDLDILADAESPTATAKDLQQAVAYADEMREIELSLLKLKERAKELTARYDKLQLELLPDVMLAIGVKNFALSNGFVIEVKDFLRGSIPTIQQIAGADEFERGALIDRRNAALKWLKENNAASIIKNHVVAEFGTGQDDEAKKLFKQLQESGFKAKCEEEVNFMTLNSYLKQAIAAGKPVPADAFGLFSGKKAQLKEAKKK